MKNANSNIIHDRKKLLIDKTLKEFAQQLSDALIRISKAQTYADDLRFSSQSSFYFSHNCCQSVCFFQFPSLHQGHTGSLKNLNNVTAPDLPLDVKHSAFM